MSVSVSLVCLLVMTVCPAKADEPIEIPFRMWIRESPLNTMGPRFPRERSTFEGNIGYCMGQRVTCPAVDELKVTHKA